MRKGGLEKRTVRQQGPDARGVVAHHPVHHVGLQNAAQRRRVQRGLHGPPLLRVDLLQQRALRVEDQLVQGGHDQRRVPQVEATLRPVLGCKDRLHKSRHPLAQNVCVAPARGVQRPRRLKATDVELGSAAEVPVHKVPQRAALGTAFRGLRQRAPDGQQRPLDRREPLLRHLPATAQGFTHGLVKLLLPSFNIHTRAQRALSLTRQASSRCKRRFQPNGREDQGYTASACLAKRHG
mmetsp:Transcript_23159/g.53458  ORF Transcript_23159/g.53458 Transcript_23159/m.53458 type:complete len:237 (-) Transcript_23159:114-824(-)